MKAVITFSLDNAEAAGWFSQPVDRGDGDMIVGYLERFCFFTRSGEIRDGNGNTIGTVEVVED